MAALHKKVFTSQKGLRSTSAELGEQAVEQRVAQDVARVELPPRLVELVDREACAQPAAHLLPWSGSALGSGLGLGSGFGLGFGFGLGLG